MLKDNLISEPIIEGVEDAYMEVRAMLMPLVKEVFPGLSDYQMRTIVENIIDQSTCCLEPHKMDEKWGREEVQYIKRVCEKYKEKDEIPGLRRLLTYRDFFPIVTPEESHYFLTMLKKKILSKDEDIVYEERKFLSFVIKENTKERRLLHKLLNKKRIFKKITYEEENLLLCIERTISEHSWENMRRKREKREKDFLESLAK